MKSTKSAIRYSKALLELAIEQNKVDLVLSDMDFFYTTSSENKDLLVFLKSPIIRSDKKLTVLQALFSHFDILTTSFMQLITKNRREALLTEIAASFIKLVKDHKGIVPVTLI